MKLKFLSLFSLVTLTFFSLFGCQTKLLTPQKKASTAIAAVLPLSGKNASIGIDIRQGMDLALLEINEKGGFQNNPFQLVYGDTKSDRLTGAELVKKFSDKYPFLHLSGTSLIASVQEDLDDKPILVNYMTTYPPVPGRTPNGIRIYLSGGEEMQLLANYAAKRKFKRAIILHVEGTYGKSNAKLLDFYLAGQYIHVYLDSYVLKERDFYLFAKQVMRTNPDVFFIIGEGPEYSAIFSALERVKWQGPVICNSRYACSPSFQENLAHTFPFFYCAPSFIQNPSSPKSQHFIERFSEKFGHSPRIYSALGYDSIQALYESVLAAQSLQPDLVRKAFIQKQHYVGATGEFEISSSGDTSLELSIVEHPPSS